MISVLHAHASETYVMVGIAAIILVVAVIVLVRSYKQCPKNMIMVISGGGETTIIQKGGAFVNPIFKKHEFISLEPMTIKLDMDKFVNDIDSKATPRAVFTARVSTKPDMINNAVERFLGSPIVKITSTLEDVLSGQMRLQIAEKTAAYDRFQLAEDILASANLELAKAGIEIIEADIPQLIAQE